MCYVKICIVIITIWNRFEIERKLRQAKRERKRQKRDRLAKEQGNTSSLSNSARLASRSDITKERRRTIEDKKDRKAQAILTLKAEREKKEKKKSGKDGRQNSRRKADICIKRILFNGGFIRNGWTVTNIYNIQVLFV